MCGRYTLVKSAEELAKRFKVEIDPRYKPRYNAAPTQLLPVITADAPQGLSWFYWGLIPAWSKNKSVSQKLINARSETVDEKVSFRRALTQRRCLIPADGFYEWKALGKKSKVPYRISMKQNNLFSFAGLWEEYEEDGGETVHTFTILTTAANSLVRPIHDRMPVILKPETEALWLNKETTTEALKPLFAPYAADAMRSYTVSSRINSPQQDDDSLILPTPASDQFGNYTLFG